MKNEMERLDNEKDALEMEEIEAQKKIDDLYDNVGSEEYVMAQEELKNIEKRLEEIEDRQTELEEEEN